MSNIRLYDVSLGCRRFPMAKWRHRGSEEHYLPIVLACLRNPVRARPVVAPVVAANQNDSASALNPISYAPVLKRRVNSMGNRN